MTSMTPEQEEDCADCPHYYAAHNLSGHGTACMGYDDEALETDTFCPCKKFRRTSDV
jgi:hypothetical protein